MGLIDLLLKRKKETEEAQNYDFEETPEQRKERLAKSVKTSSGTYRKE